MTRAKKRLTLDFYIDDKHEQSAFINANDCKHGNKVKISPVAAVLGDMVSYTLELEGFILDLRLREKNTHFDFTK